VTETQGIRRKQLLDDFKEQRKYCKLKQEALDRLPGELALEESVDMALRNE
jgi:hypothetical protein